MSSQRPWTYERGTLWAMDLDGATPVVVAPQIAASFGEVPCEAVAPLATAMGLANIHDVRRRFDAGSQCFAAWVDGKLAAYGWVSWGTECIGELECSLRMQPDEAYIWDCATLPPYRRQGLYSALLGHIATLLRAQGMRRVWIGASLRNRPSIRGFAAAGFHPAIRLTYVRVLTARMVRVSDEPDAPPSLAADARRALIDSRGADASPAASPGAATVYSDAPAEEKCL
jgi:GNAT superfamily N-acetyltransferase